MNAVVFMRIATNRLNYSTIEKFGEKYEIGHQLTSHSSYFTN